MILNKDELSIIHNKHFFNLKQSALQKIENELIVGFKKIRMEMKVMVRFEITN